MGAESRARPTEFLTGLPLISFVNSSLPFGLTSASPWRIRFFWPGVNFEKENEIYSADSTLRNMRKKAMYVDRRRKNE